MSGHRCRLAASLLGGALVAGVGADALAQQPVPGGTGETGMSSPAVFGGARRTAQGEPSLTFSGSTFGGYDTNILAGGGVGAGSGSALGSTDQTSSSFAGASAGLDWHQTRSRVDFGGSLGGQYRTFFDIDDFDLTTYHGNGSLLARLTQRSSLALAAGASLRPFYQFGTLGSIAAVEGAGLEGTAFMPDFQAAREQVLRYGTSAEYRYRLGRRTTFSAGGRRVGFHDMNAEARESGLRGLGGTTGSVRLEHLLTPNLGVRAGYGYTQYDRLRVSPLEPGARRLGVHNIDVGFNYGSALTIARRTYFSFGTGTNVVRAYNAEYSDTAYTRLNVSGFAVLRRDFLRTWSTALQYRRGTNYVEGYNDFGVFDSAVATVGGLLSDRLDASAAVTYTHGTLGLGRGAPIGTTSAGTQLRYAFTSNLAGFVSYTYAHFDVPEARRPVVVSGEYRPERQGVRVGLSLWFDLLR